MYQHVYDSTDLAEEQRKSILCVPSYLQQQAWATRLERRALVEL